MKAKIKRTLILIGIIITTTICLNIYLNSKTTIQLQIIKEMEKQELIFSSMSLLKINTKDTKTTEYIYKDSQYYYFFNLIEGENKNYDIYIYVEENNGTPIMPTYLEYTDENSHYIYLTAKNNKFLTFPNYEIKIEKMVSKK